MISKYLRVYKEYINHAFAEALSYRAHFVLLIIMDLLFYASLMFSVDFIFDHIDQLGPWRRDEFLFFIAFMLAVDHIHMSLISESFWTLSTDIRTGALDFILLRPMGSIFQIFFRHIRAASFFNLFAPWSLLFYFGTKIDLSIQAWISLPFLVLMSLALLVSIEIVISMSMFWTVESFGINFLRMQLQQLARWPDFIYRFYARKFFTLALPVLLVGSAPVKFLIDFKKWPWLVSMIVATLSCWVVLYYLWKLALKSYESASS